MSDTEKQAELARALSPYYEKKYKMYTWAMVGLLAIVLFFLYMFASLIGIKTTNEFEAATGTIVRLIFSIAGALAFLSTVNVAVREKNWKIGVVSGLFGHTLYIFVEYFFDK